MARGVVLPPAPETTQQRQAIATLARVAPEARAAEAAVGSAEWAFQEQAVAFELGRGDELRLAMAEHALDAAERLLRRKRAAVAGLKMLAPPY